MNQPLVDQKQCLERQVTTARKSLEIPGMDCVRNIWRVAILRDPQRTTKHIVSLAKTTYRWCHRNPFVAALSAVSAATLLIGMAVFMHTITKSDRDADASPLNRPEQQTAKAEPGEELAEQRRIEADNNNNSRRAGRELYGAHMKLAQIAWDDSRPGEIVRLTLKGHTGTVTSVAFSPDGQRLVSGSYDQTLKIWDARCLETSP